MMSQPHPLPRLPSELLQQIFSDILQEPRTITIRPNGHGKRVSFTPSRHPALLQVDRESRRQSLHYYSRYFRDDGTQTTTSSELTESIDVTRADGIYADMNRDVFELHDYDIWLFNCVYNPTELVHFKDIQHLDIAITETPIAYRNYPLARILDSIDGLRTIRLVMKLPRRDPHIDSDESWTSADYDRCWIRVRSVLTAIESCGRAQHAIVDLVLPGNTSVYFHKPTGRLRTCSSELHYSCLWYRLGELYAQRWDEGIPSDQFQIMLEELLEHN